MKRIVVCLIIVFISITSVYSQTSVESIKCQSQCQREYKTEVAFCRSTYKTDVISKTECLKIAKLNLETCLDLCP